VVHELPDPLVNPPSATDANSKGPSGKRRRIWIVSGLGVIVAIGLTISIGAILVQRLNPAQRSLHQHAANASIVMENEPAGASGIDLARSVVGKGTDDTISVLAASGTRRHGEVLLRIEVTVQPTSEFGSTDRAVGCFSYSFDYDASPNEVSCPDEGPLQLPPPEPSTSTTVS
jgi:hypothetical protein